MASTKSRAWAISSAAHISSSVASALPYRRLERTVPENSQAFWGTSPMVDQSSVRLEVAYVDAVDEHPTAGDVEEPRHQVDHGALAGTGGADQGHGLAGAGLEGDVADDRHVGARGRLKSTWSKTRVPRLADRR